MIIVQGPTPDDPDLMLTDEQWQAAKVHRAAVASAAGSLLYHSSRLKKILDGAKPVA